MIRIVSFVCCCYLAIAITCNSAIAEDVPPLRDGQMTNVLGAPKTSAMQKSIVFINGMNTSSSRAIEQATKTAEHLGNGVRLIFNDLTMPIVDHFSAAIEKLLNADLSVNAATEALVKEIKRHVESGQDIYVIGFSAGGLVTNNAVRKVAEDYKGSNKRSQWLARIHVVVVGGAVFNDEHPLSDGWPKELGSHFELYDAHDEIAQLFGLADWDDTNDDAHSYSTNYLPHINSEMLTKGGTKILHKD